MLDCPQVNAQKLKLRSLRFNAVTEPPPVTLSLMS
jgi:hypothetical protein